MCKLISMFLFFSLQLQVIHNFKYVKMEIYHQNRYLQYKFKVGEHVLF